MKRTKHHIRIFTTEQYQVQGKIFYQALVEYLKINGYAGVTVLRGIAGFGHGRASDAKVGMPIIIEIMEDAENAARLLEKLREWNIINDCIVITEEILIES